jgi:hypothetical protein
MMTKTHMVFGHVSLKSVIHYLYHEKKVLWPGHSCRDCMVVGFTTTHAISAYHH